MTCACGCGAELSGRQRLYASNACKSRHWKAQHGYTLSASFERCQTPKKRGSGPSGLQGSYVRAVQAMTSYLVGVEGHAPDVAEPIAALAMKMMLSDKQRARLDART